MSDADTTRQKVDAKLFSRAALLHQIKEEKSHLEQASEKVENLKQALDVLQEVAESVQQQAHERIARLVTKCLAMVFGREAYTFEIEFEKKASRTQANLLFRRGEHLLDPMDSSGGGTIDVAAFALRLSCLSLQLPQKRHLVVMDEPFKNVSPNYRPRIKAMLEMLTEELGFQFIVATNMTSIQAGNIFELE